MHVQQFAISTTTTSNATTTTTAATITTTKKQYQMKQQQQKHGSGTIIFYSFCHERMDGEKSPTKAALLALSSFFLPYEERPAADVLCVEKGRAQ